jgi:thiol-disulfide isomerase/thioredoxin
MKQLFTSTTDSLLVFVLTVFISGAAAAQGKSLAGMNLEDMEGGSAHLSEYLQKGPVYINFWALWCEPCKNELRALKSFAKEHANDPFTILAVNQDSPKSLAKVKAYVKSQGYPFKVILDPNTQIFQALNGQNLPFAVLIDKSGKIVSSRTGFLPGDEKEIAEEILKLVTPN